MALFEPALTRKSIAGQAIWFSSWVAVTVIGAFLTPSRYGHGTHEQLGLPPCPSVMFFDRPCPGCGLTTSFTAFIHGQFAEAIHAHPLGPLLYLVFTATAFASLFGYLRTKRFNLGDRGMSIATWVFAVIFLGFGVARWIATSSYSAPGERPAFVFRGLEIGSSRRAR